MLGVTNIPDDAIGLLAPDLQLDDTDAQADLATRLTLDPGGPDAVTAPEGHSWIDTGAGADSVTGGGESVVARLGGGNDSYAATGEGHAVWGGSGDDSYTGAANDPTAAPLFGQNRVDLGAGDDTFDIRGGTGRFSGGDGDDSFAIGPDADPGPGPTATQDDTLYGGSGADSFDVARGDVRIGLHGSLGGDAPDTVTLRTTAQSLEDGLVRIDSFGRTELDAEGDPVGFDDRLTIRIDPSLTGAITYVDSVPDESGNLSSTRILVGGIAVAEIDYAVEDPDDTIGLRDGDGQLTIIRG